MSFPCNLRKPKRRLPYHHKALEGRDCPRLLYRHRAWRSARYTLLAVEADGTAAKITEFYEAVCPRSSLFMQETFVNSVNLFTSPLTHS